ncbi:fructosamine kinase family protein [Nocardia bovistercoris]|uniref:Fructosamine kinase family protein n=1 Tax=Nocardia bovistercoris TaxID=2785916 RepID=A0A931IGQ9_9NOCA|nr:fructosamine kinase family protein [Nocardia bovistercoris]MBH0779455.1 fructosamine kinase family protein [Nocardia bovistercoris]
MSLAVRLGELLDGTVRGIADLGTSHSWTLHRAILSDGRDVFVKSTAAHAGALAAEADGLRWLGAAAPNAVASVLAVNETLLVLPWLPESAPTPEAAEQLGRDLAALHAHTPAAFGAPWPGWIARLPLDNTETAEMSWARWYAERRLAPYLPAAARHLGPDGVRLVERVIDRVEALAGPPEPPARIHGDLWSGNIRWCRDRARLIDPAAHGGHRETDLAMLALFGAPQLDRLMGAYQEARPLADGWRERSPLHQLHPLLVHVVLFGRSYREKVVAAAEAALAV